MPCRAFKIQWGRTLSGEELRLEKNPQGEDLRLEKNLQREDLPVGQNPSQAQR